MVPWDRGGCGAPRRGKCLELRGRGRWYAPRKRPSPTQRLTTVLAAPFFYLAAGEAHAQVCQVDPTGSLGHPHATVDDALTSGGCDAPGSEIIVFCPSGGCAHPAITLENLVDVSITSGEFTAAPGKSGPVRIEAPSDPAAVRVTGSDGIELLGFRGIEAAEHGLEIIDSIVRVAGPQEYGVPGYMDIRAPTGAGARVRGGSDLTLEWVGITGSRKGLDIASNGGGAPFVSARGVVLLGNLTAAVMTGGTTSCPASGGPELEIRSDFDVAWLNYIMGNDEGFLLRGASVLSLDHAVLGGNLRNRPVSRSNGMLFELRDAASLVGRNLAVYDNDRIRNPGVALPWSQSHGPNTASIILWHDSCEKSTIRASSFVDNESDLVFHMDAGVSPGSLRLEHVVVANSSGKTISASGFAPSCPALDVTGSMLWENRTIMDPPHCAASFQDTTTNVDPGVVTSPQTPDTLPNYPGIKPPPFDLYLLDRHEPTHEQTPVDLYPAKKWGVDGTPDVDDLAVGFHNRLPY